MSSPVVQVMVTEARRLDRVELAALISDLLDLQVSQAAAVARADIDANPVSHEAGVM